MTAPVGRFTRSAPLRGSVSQIALHAPVSDKVIGYANSISVGKAVAFGVATAVMRDDGDPFGELSFEV